MFLYNLIALNVNAQDSCYTCDRDSMITKLSIAKTNVEKVKLLTLIIDFAPNADSANLYIQQLIDVNSQQKLIDIEPYKIIKQANNFYSKKEYVNALRYYKNAVEIFDKKRKKIVNLLLSFRNLFNLLNMQEERFKYYNDKLSYYLLNGPFENTAAAYHGVGGYYTYTADYNQAISYYLKGAEVFKKFYPYWYHNALGIIGIYYAEWGNLKKGLDYLNYTLPILKSLWSQRPPVKRTGAYYEVALSQIKIKQKKYSEALQHAELIITPFRTDTTNRFYAIGLLLKALVYVHSNQQAKAYPLLVKAKNISDSFHNGRMTTYNSTLEIDHGLYQYFASIKDYRSAERYLLNAYKRAVEEKSNVFQLKYLKELSTFYVSINYLSLSKKYINEYFALKDSIDEKQSSFKIAQYENEKRQIDQLQNINVLKQERAVQQAAISKRNTILFISFVALLLIVASMFFLYKQLQVNKKNLKYLKETQSQLIQSEKMASLGELTAGIAHEIQNPLNFVNNFSDVNSELIDELIGERSKKNGERDSRLEDEILNDIADNERKINHHGKRADAIVKGMLQHSRASTGKKEPTDINALADEYLRLSYHGLRAKDKDFNADFKTDFDERIGKIEIVPQDIGRVLLNLYNNAFYAASLPSKGGFKDSPGNHKPAIWVTTSKIPPSGGGGAVISVRDNGPGISKNILNKIFQPFFTTKPTGQGTGLGLSLSYDIIKAHGGEMKVDSREGEGAEFIIQLLLNPTNILNPSSDHL